MRAVRWWWLLGLGASVGAASCGSSGAEQGPQIEVNGDGGSAGSSGSSGGGKGGSAGRGGSAGKGGSAGPSGEALWSKHFAGVSDRYVVWAAPAPGGDVVVTGFFVGTIDLGGDPLSSGEKWTSTDPQWAIFVARFDADGKHVWSKRFGGDGASRPQSAAVDDKGNVTVVGGFSGTLSFGDTSLVSTAASSVFVARLDSKGAPVWAKRYGDSGEQAANAVAIDSKGNALIAGALGGSADFGEGPLTSAGSQDVFVLKLDKTGQHVWSKRFGDAAPQRALGLAVDEDDSAVLTGSFAGSLDLGGGPLASAGGSDLFVARLNSLGEHVWSFRHGDGSDQLGRAVAVASGRVSIAGEFGGVLDLGPVTGDATPISKCSGKGYAPYEANGHCYYQGTTTKSYDDARDACKALGAGWALASLSTLDEFTFVRFAFPGVKGWLGGSDAAADGTWVWDNGEPFTYAGSAYPWNMGEPNGGKTENCIEMNDGKMNDLPCTELRTFLCENATPGAGGAGGAGGAAGNGGAAGASGGSGQAGAGGAAGDGGAAGAPLSKTAHKSKGGLDAFVAQFDARGRKLWDQAYGADDEQRLWALAHDGDGNVVIGGDFAGDVDLGGGTLSKGRVVLASLGRNDGKLRWGKRFGPGLGQGLALAASPTRLFLGGVFSGQLDLGSGSLDAADHAGAFFGAFEPLPGVGVYALGLGPPLAHPAFGCACRRWFSAPVGGRWGRLPAVVFGACRHWFSAPVGIGFYERGARAAPRAPGACQRCFSLVLRARGSRRPSRSGAARGPWGPQSRPPGGPLASPSPPGFKGVRVFRIGAGRGESYPISPLAHACGAGPAGLGARRKRRCTQGEQQNRFLPSQAHKPSAYKPRTCQAPSTEPANRQAPGSQATVG